MSAKLAYFSLRDMKYEDSASVSGKTVKINDKVYSVKDICQALCYGNQPLYSICRNPNSIWDIPEGTADLLPLVDNALVRDLLDAFIPRRDCDMLVPFTNPEDEVQRTTNSFA